MSTAITKRSPIKQVGGAEVTTEIIFGKDDNGEQIGMLVKSDRRGKARIAIRNVRLTFYRKELYSFNSKAHDNTPPADADPNISAIGYDRLNEFAGILMDTPETQLDDDNRTTGNPQMIREPSTGRLQAVRVMMRGIGVSQSGNVVTHRNSKYFNLDSYLAETVMAKWKGWKDDDTPKKWGRIVVRDKIDPKELADGTKWAIPVPPNLALLVDLTSNIVVKMISDNITLEKFALDRAQTMCRRNLLRRFFGVVKPRVGEDKDGLYYFVPVTCLIRHNEDYADMAAAIQQVEQGVVFMHDGSSQQAQETPIQHDTGNSPDDLHDELDGADEFTPQPDPDEPAAAGVAPTAKAAAEPEPDDSALILVQMRGTVKLMAEQLANIGAAQVPVVSRIYADHGMRSYVDVAQCTNVETLTSLADAFRSAKRDAGAGRKAGKGAQQPLIQ